MMTTRFTSNKVRVIETRDHDDAEHEGRVGRAITWLNKDGYEVISATSSVSMALGSYGRVSNVVTTLLARKYEDEG